MLNYRLIDTFETKLGIINFEISLPSNHKITSHNNKIDISTENFCIEVYLLKEYEKSYNRNTLYPKFNIKEGIGWIFRLKKLTNSIEEVCIRCTLEPNAKDIIREPDSGEHLDSIWFTNHKYELNIGTEDGNVLRDRAKENNWMPSRFQDILGTWQPMFSFTKYLNYGFETEIPILKAEEEIYLHYLVALDDCKPNTVAPSMAVDMPKRNIIKMLGIDD